MRRLLFITHRVPYPPDKGERLRAFHQLCALAPHYRVTLAALAHSESDLAAAEPLRQWCETLLLGRAGGRAGLARGALSLLAGGSVTEGYFRCRPLESAIRAEAGESGFDLAIGCCSAVLPLLLAAPAGARVMDLIDLDSAKWAHYARESLPPQRWLYGLEARGVRALEARAQKQCQAVLLVSEQEARDLPARGENVFAMGNGVDTDYFRPPDSPATDRSPAATRPDGLNLVFTGTMDYRPNVEGVCWFAREVLPALREWSPGVTFTVVGRDPAKAVRRLAGAAGVEVTGAVPDVRPYLARASAAVVPLHIARGIQNKILEAMAMGRAVVASPQALAGLDVEVGRDLLRADTAEEWRSALIRLLCDDGLRQELGRSARSHVEKHYTWPAQTEPLVALCRRLTGEAADPGALRAGEGGPISANSTQPAQKPTPEGEPGGASPIPLANELDESGSLGWHPQTAVSFGGVPRPHPQARSRLGVPPRQAVPGIPAQGNTAREPAR